MSAVFALALLMPQSVALSRTYATGALPDCTAQLQVEFEGGQVDITAKLKRQVEKLTDGGGAEIRHTLENVKTALNGKELADPRTKAAEQSWLSTLDKFGAPTVPSQIPNGILFVELLNTYLLSAVLPKAAVSVGDKYPVKIDERGTRLEGTCTLAEIKEGIVRITSDYTLTRFRDNTKLALKVTSWVEQSTGDTLKVQGASMKPGAPADTGVKRLTFLIERAKP